MHPAGCPVLNFWLKACSLYYKVQFIIEVTLSGQPTECVFTIVSMAKCSDQEMEKTEFILSNLL